VAERRNGKTHPFEAHGLGRAPFRLIGCEYCEPRIRCDFCEKHIAYRFECESKDGKKFGVGKIASTRLSQLAQLCASQ
jgi:hypothetical protein